MRWLLTRARGPYLLLLTAITLLFLWPLSGLQVDRSNSAMVAQDSQQEELHQRFKQLFGHDEYLLLSLTSPQLLDPAGLQLLDKLDGEIRAIAGVKSILSLSNARQLRGGDFGAEPAPLVERPLSNPAGRSRLEQALDADPRLAELLISADRRTAAITIEVDNLPTGDPRLEQVVARIRALMAAHSTEGELHLTGTLVQKQDVASFVMRDQRVLMPLSVLILALCLALAFRRLSGVLLPLLVTAVSLAITLGGYALAGLKLNTITSLLPPVVMVLSVTTSIHLYNAWLRQRSKEDLVNPTRLLLSRVRELRRPCFYTALTTALGLLSLCLSEIPAVRSFGAFAALGVMVSFVVGITLVPVGLSYLDPRQAGNPYNSGPIRVFLHWSTRLATRHSGRIFTLSLLAGLMCVPGFFQIRNNTDLVRFLRADAPLYRDTLYIDRALGGVNPLDFLLERRDGTPLTRPDDQRRLALFSARLRTLAGVGSVTSLADLIGRLQQVESNSASPNLPQHQDQLNYLLDLLRDSPDRTLIARLTTADYRSLRINTRLRALGTAETMQLVEQAEQLAAKTLGAEYLLAPTGGYFRIASESNRLVYTLLKSFGLSLALVMLAIAVMFRRPGLVLAALVPNLVPLLWSGGLMGYVGIDLSTGTAMIGAVVFGLIVDATIHYLARYQHFAAESPRRAIEHTTFSIGRALTIASLVLVLGFWVGCFGSFKPTIYFSLLVGTTMLGALFCDLLVLPACLVLRERWFGGAA